MLLNFSFNNFRSFAETQQFSMQRVYSEYSSDLWEQPMVSSVAAVYGPNASGKTCFLEALEFVSQFARISLREGDALRPIPVEPFLLDSMSPERPSEFLIEFVARDGYRYVFSFGVTSKEVVYEELVVYYSSQPTKLYTRSSDDGKQTIKFAAALKGPKKQVWSITRANSLFISAAALSGLEALNDAYLGLVYGIELYDAADYPGELYNIKMMAKDGDSTIDELSEIVSYADIGVLAIDVRRASESGENAEAIERGLKIAERAKELSDSEASDLKWLMGTDVYFLHQGVDEAVWLSSSHESDGTIAALSFFSLALHALKDGTTILVDEMERSLHPTLLKEFVKLFADPHTNPRQAQLIFTTHDTALISASSPDERVLQRDQVWLCDKGKDGKSSLFPVTDYSPKRRENLGRNYLNGIYHALPSPRFHEHFAELISSSNQDDND